MTPREALARACLEARRFRYIPDSTATDLLARLAEDVWDTVGEFEARQGGDCFPLEQRIICRDARTGLYALPSLAELRSAYPDYEALSYDFDARKWVFRPITAWQSKGVRPVVEARLMNGSRFRVTPDHLVWVLKPVIWRKRDRSGYVVRNKIAECRISQIKPEAAYWRRLIVASRIPSLAACYDSDLSYLDGIYAAEGYIKERGKRAVAIAQDKPDIRAKIERALNSLGISYRPSKRLVHASYHVHASVWADHFRRHGMHSRDKTLPFEALSSYPAVVERLVEGHRDGDAYVPQSTSRHYRRCEAIHATSSDELKRRLVLAFLILGKQVNRNLQRVHQGVGRHPIWRLTVGGDRLKHDRRIPDYDGLGFNGVRSIVPAGQTEVVDITVAGTHNFVLDDGVLVHNCDGFSIWTIERASALAPTGRYAMVVGAVRQRGRLLGHAWVQLLDTGEWADPTWGWGPMSPAALGWPAARQPHSRLVFDGTAFPVQEDYPA